MKEDIVSDTAHNREEDEYNREDADRYWADLESDLVDTYLYPEESVPKVLLPIEPGFYITAYDEPDIFELKNNKHWYLANQEISAERVAHDGGNQLTRLA